MNDLIGVFDSGIGGVTILEKLAAHFKNNTFIYYGDNDYAPYGDKTNEYILSRAVECVKILKGKGCKIIVVACNTVSLVCGEKLNALFPQNIFVFMKPYFLDKGSERVIFCTTATAKMLLKDKLAKKEEVYPLPDMAKLIEKDFSKVRYRDFLNCFDKVVPYRKIILGCTHYSFVKKYFMLTFPDAEIDDCADRVINQLEEILNDTKANWERLNVSLNTGGGLLARSRLKKRKNRVKQGNLTTGGKRRAKKGSNHKNYAKILFIGVNATKNESALGLLSVRKSHRWS